MGKTLEVLQNLKRVQEEEKKRIEQLHEKHLQSLKNDILRLSENTLSQIEKNIIKSNSKEIEEIKKRIEGIEQMFEWCREEKLWNWAIWGGVGGITAMVALNYVIKLFLKGG